MLALLGDEVGLEAAPVVNVVIEVCAERLESRHPISGMRGIGCSSFESSELARGEA